MKNYTSSVPVANTILRIEEVLVRAGANNIVKDYDDERRIAAIAFTIVIDPNTKQRIAIRLPANVDAVHKALRKALYPKRGTPTGAWAKRIAEQAPRTAWKLMQDWLEVQLSLIEMNQADLVQVFLPYVWDGRQTLYSKLKEGGFQGLPAPPSDSSVRALPAPEEVK